MKFSVGKKQSAAKKARVHPTGRSQTIKLLRTPVAADSWAEAAATSNTSGDHRKAAHSLPCAESSTIVCWLKKLRHER